jgi:hypothetical protein
LNGRLGGPNSRSGRGGEEKKSPPFIILPFTKHGMCSTTVLAIQKLNCFRKSVIGKLVMIHHAIANLIIIIIIIKSKVDPVLN